MVYIHMGPVDVRGRVRVPGVDAPARDVIDPRPYASARYDFG